MTKAQAPTLPQKGGSYIVQKGGKLKQVHETKPPLKPSGKAVDKAEDAAPEITAAGGKK